LENFYDKCNNSLGQFSSVIQQRIDLHNEFVQGRLDAGKPIKYENTHYGFPVITNQEKEIVFSIPVSVEQQDDESLVVNYAFPSRETSNVFAAATNTPTVAGTCGATSRAGGLLFPDFDPGH
jgi:hypothetical protein